MRKFLFPIQKLAMVFFYLQLLVELDKPTYLTCSLILMGLSVAFEGARPYTPLLFFIIILEMFDLSLLQVIVIIIAGVATAALKLYDINVPIKSPYLMGHKYKLLKLEDKSQISVSLFYPTLIKTKRIQWIPKKQYNKVLYEIFHVDPKARRIPYRLFNFVVSYIHRIYMPAQQLSPYLSQPLTSTDSAFEKNKEKVIVFSHGLGSHMNAYSSIFANWAGQGYTIVSVNHDKDEVCVDYRVKVKNQDPQQIKEYLHEFRNRDLEIRVKEMQKVIDIVKGQNFMRDYFGVEIEVKQIILAGHSFGGGTCLATKSYLNKKYKNNPQQIKLQKIICLDPWLFPFNQEHFDNLQNEDILIINSEHFYKEVPYIYELEKLYNKLKQNNMGMKAYVVKGMDHIAQCDMAYVFGNILKATGSIKLHQLTDQFMGLNILMTNLFMQDKSKQQILQVSNKYVQDRRMDMYKVRVQQQYRTTRDITFGRQQQTDSEKEIIDKI